MWDCLGVWSVVVVSNYSCLQLCLMSPPVLCGCFWTLLPSSWCGIENRLVLGFAGTGKVRHFQDLGLLGIL